MDMVLAKTLADHHITQAVLDESYAQALEQAAAKAGVTLRHTSSATARITERSFFMEHTSLSIGSISLRSGGIPLLPENFHNHDAYAPARRKMAAADSAA